MPFIKDAIRVICGGLLLFALARSASAQALLLPTPPRQAAEWTAPDTKLPPEFVAATKALFGCGLADPRGCEYRSISIRTGYRQPGLLTKTEGWVLPGKPGERRFAVCWNGCLYPTESIGEPADVRRSVAAAVQQRQAWKDSHVQNLCVFEADHVSALSYDDPVKACLLLRLGEARLAEAIWSPTYARPQTLHSGLLAAAVHRVHQRALNAHLRSDDALALPAARQLAEMLKAMNEVEASRLFAPADFDLEALFADQERRARARKTTSTMVRQPRIALLLADLENVALTPGHAWDVGWYRTQPDPRLQALRDRGEEAIGPLLDCAEHDQRLTRSQRQEAFSAPTANLRRVAEVAAALLSERLEADTFCGDRVFELERQWLKQDNEIARQELIELLRAQAAKAKGRTRPQIWLDVLADDGAAPEAWVRAAERIVAPVENHAGAVPKLQGEPLRGERAPAVTSALIKRLKQLDEMSRLPEEYQAAAQHLEEADDLFKLLVVWEPDATRSLMKDHWARLLRYHALTKASGRASHRITRFTQERLTQRDDQALPDYFAWLEAQRPETLDDFAQALRPLQWNSQHPAAAKVAERLFARGDSPWNPVLNHRFGVTHSVDLLASPLLAIPAFRQHVLEQLKNEEIVGELTVVKPGHARGKTAYNYGSLQESSTLPDDARAAAVGEKVSVRICDAHALALARAGGLPNFKLIWTREHRNAAIVKCRETLERYGNRYRGTMEDQFTPMAFRLPRFEALPAAASAQDVAAGRAIFTLGTEHPVRKVSVAPLGREAIWFTSRSEPFQQIVGNRPVIAYDNRGRIWQAEEFQIDGQWRRFYGFVSQYGMAKVAAEEIEFAPDSYYSQLANGIHGRLEFTKRAGGELQSVPASSRERLRVQLKLRNGRAVAQAIARDWVRRNLQGTIQWREGMEFRVTRTFNEAGLSGDYSRGSGFCEACVVSSRESFAPDKAEAEVHLDPAEEFVAATFDVEDVCDLNRAGVYTLEMTLPGDELIAGRQPLLRLSWRIEE